MRAERHGRAGHRDLDVSLVAGDGVVDEGPAEVSVHPRASASVDAESVLGGFRDAGLWAVARHVADGRWALEVGSTRLAQWVTVRVPGFDVEDSWFHLPPGMPQTVSLRSRTAGGPPRGVVAALNSRSRVPIRVAD